MGVFIPLPRSMGWKKLGVGSGLYIIFAGINSAFSVKSLALLQHGLQGSAQAQAESFWRGQPKRSRLRPVTPVG